MEKLNKYLPPVTAVLVVIVLLLSWATYSNLSEFKTSFDKLTQGQQPSQPSAPKVVDVKIGDSPDKGPENAKVEVVIFSDPSCPFCGAAAGMAEQVVSYMKQRDPSWQAAVPNIIKDYVDIGKVRIAFKYFPGHGKGQDAMKIMWCADEQGKFWEIHDVMFKNQEMMESGNAAGLKSSAVSAGLDQARLEACLSSGKYDSWFNRDTQEGSSYGVGGTPAFFVNGRLVEGAVSYPTIKAIIEEELNK